MSLADQRKQAEKEGLIGSGYFKVKDGQNRIRIVSDALPHPGEFKKGNSVTKTFKWLLYVIDRADGTVKPYFMPTRVFDMVADLQGDEEFTFEGMPMPYDVVINAKGAGTIDVEYTVVPRKATPITAAERNLIDAAKPLKELQEQINAKNAGSQQAKNFDPDELPV